MTEPEEEFTSAVTDEEAARLEAEVARLVEADRRRQEAAAQPVDYLARVKQLVNDSARERGGVPVEDFPVWDDPREYARQVRREAWCKALVDARHDDYLDMTVDRLTPEQMPKTISRFVEIVGVPGAEVINLILTGTVGSGKTAAAIAAGHLAADRGLYVRFATHQSYLTWLRPDSAPAGRSPVWVREQHDRADLLILDDLGAEENLDGGASAFVRKETIELLTKRLASNRATIITTNLSSADLGAMLGDRIVSRLGARAHVLKFIGEDRRKPVSW